MSTKTTIARRIAAGLIAAFALTACGNGGGNNQAGGGDVIGNNGDGGGETTLDDLALPVTATYGYLDLTVVTVEEGNQAPEDIRAEEPSTYVTVELSIDNPVDEWSYTLPGGLFSFSSGGQEYRGATEDGESIEVRPGPNATSTATVWFTLPTDEVITAPELLVRDSGYEPLSISLARESVPPESVPVSMDGNFETVCEEIKFGEAIANFNNRLTDGGEALPAPGVSTLGRAAEDQVLVTFDVNATESCGGLGTWFSIQGGSAPVLQLAEVDGNGVEVEANVGQPDNEGVEGQIAFAVPADANAPLEITWRNYHTDPWSTITTSASLEPLAELTAE